MERDPERLATFRKIDEFLHASEISATTAMSIAQTIWAGVLEEQSEGSGPDAMASLDGALEALYPQILAEVREYVLVSSAWTYRDFSLEEVRIYMEFLQSAAARATYAALQAGLSDAMEKRGQEIGRAFGQVLKQRKA